MRQLQNNEQKSGHRKPKISQEPDVEKNIRSDAWISRKLTLELERAAFDQSNGKDAQLDALSKLYRKREALDKKIKRTSAELRKMMAALIIKREHLKKILIGKYGEYQGKLEYQRDIEGNDPTLEKRTYLDELEKCSNACQFALERLSFSPDFDVRNKAFGLVQDNLIAVKIIFSNSEHSDIRERARAILKAAKGKNNQYFYNYTQKPGKDTVLVPDW